jgi:ParB-like chromosome segregation protein Spo0J
MAVAARKIEQGQSLKVTFRPLSQLLPYARNARVHSPDQVAVLVRSIQEFGFINPVLVDDDGMIVAGHGRVFAAAKLGLTQVPTIVLSHLTPAQVRAYRLMDNQSALRSTWDDDLLKIELADLKLLDFDLDLTGFDNAELEALLEDAAPERPDTSAQLAGLSYSVVVRCEDEAQQGELLARFEQEGLTVEALIS